MALRPPAYSFAALCRAGACALLLPVAAMLPGAATVSANVLPAPKPDPSFPFSTEIEDFARADNAGTAVPDATLFLGSSSIRLWDIRGSFPDIPTVNRGFGGATTPDVLHYYPRLRPRIAPRSIVVYVGENDLATGATPEKIARDVLSLIGKLRTDYPRAPILWMSLKPSPMRWTLWPKMVAVNRIVGARAGKDRFDYLDVGQVLLANDGLPDASLFRPDGLHMNARGYTLWTRLIERWLAGRIAAPTRAVVTTTPADAKPASNPASKPPQKPGTPLPPPPGLSTATLAPRALP